MGRYFTILLAACIILLACSKESSDKPLCEEKNQGFVQFQNNSGKKYQVFREADSSAAFHTLNPSDMTGTLAVSMGPQKYIWKEVGGTGREVDSVNVLRCGTHKMTVNQ